MRGGTAAALFLLLLHHYRSVPTGPQEITVRPGEDVTLPCQASSGVIALLAWRRTESKTDKYVFFLRVGKPNEIFQEPSLRGRVELRDPEMKDGDGSIILKNVTANDSGTYECRVAVGNTGRRKRDTPEIINIIHLDVKELGPRAGAQDDEGTPGSVASVTVSVVPAAGGTFVAIVAVAVTAVLIIYKKMSSCHGSWLIEDTANQKVDLVFKYSEKRLKETLDLILAMFKY